jgi:hypothetical protein
VVEPVVPICFLDHDIDSLPPEIQSMESVHFVRGSTIHPESFIKSGVVNNKCIIVFPSGSSGDTDGQTASIVSQLCRFTDGRIKIIYHLVKPENESLFEGLYGDADFRYAPDFGDGPGMPDSSTAQIFTELLLNTKNANPKTVEVDEKIIGMVGYIGGGH